MLLRSMLLTALVIATLPVSLNSQSAQFTFGVGVAQIDGSGVSTTSLWHISAERQLLKPWARLQGRISVSRPNEDVIGYVTYVVPEIVLQAQLSNQRVQPFFNVGAGIARISGRSVASFTNLSLSAGAGVRAGLYRNLGSQIEARARGIGSSFGRSMTEVTLGFSWQL